MSIVSTIINRLNMQRFFYGDGAEPQPVILHRKKVYIFPTRHGFVFIILLLVMLVGSINYNNSLGYMLTFLLGSLVVNAILFTYNNLLNLKVTVATPSAVFAGQTLSVPITIYNTGNNRFAISIYFDSNQVTIFDCKSTSTTTVSISMLATNRGQHKVPRFTLATTFPLGLLRAWSYVEVDRSYLVFPKPLGKSYIPQLTNYLYAEEGEKGYGSDDFAGLRVYQPGDSFRQVNWKSLAKQQGLSTKLFSGDRSDRIWFDWSQTSGTTEQRLSQLCLWIIEADKQQLTYGLKIPGTEFTPASGEQHKLSCLTQLALFNYAA